MTAADDGTVQRFTGLGDHVDMVDSEIASMLRGRAVGTPRFRAWAVCLIVPTVALSCALVVWAAWFGDADLARPAQVGWAVTLPVMAVAFLWLIGRSGTAVDDVGLRSMRLVGDDRDLHASPSSRTSTDAIPRSATFALADDPPGTTSQREKGSGGGATHRFSTFRAYRPA